MMMTSIALLAGSVPEWSPMRGSGSDLIALKKRVGRSDGYAIDLYASAANLDAIDFADAESCDGLMSLKSALEALASLDSAGADLGQTLVPLSTDGAGNYVCVDNDSGRVVFFDHEEDHIESVARTLDAYCKRLAGELKTAQRAKALEKKVSEAPALAEGPLDFAPRKLKKLDRPDLKRFDSKRYTCQINSVQFADDVQLLFHFHESCMLWDLSRKEEPDDDFPEGSSSANASKQRIAIATDDNVLLYNYAGELQTGWAASESEGTVGWIPGTDWLATWGGDKPGIRLWDVKAIARHVPDDDDVMDWSAPKEVPSVVLAEDTVFWSVEFEPTGSTFIACDADERVVTIWNVAKREAVASLVRPKRASVWLSALSSSWVAVSTGKDVRVCDHHGVEKFKWKTDGELTALHFVNDGFVVWTTETDLHLSTVAGEHIHSVRVSKKGNRSHWVTGRGQHVITMSPLALYQLVR